MLLARGVIAGVETFGDASGGFFNMLSGDQLDSLAPAGYRLPLTDVALLSPVEPRRIFVLLGGFRRRTETLADASCPQIIAKYASPVSGSGGVIAVDSYVGDGQANIEVELALVVKRFLRDADAGESRDAILGYTCFNDVSAPKIFDTAGYFLAKSIDGFASMGPWIRTDLSEEDISRGLELSSWVNGKRVQHGNTRSQRFSPSEILSFLSRHMTIMPGDVVSLGTPPPAAPVQPGDFVELEIEGIGRLENSIVASRDLSGWPKLA